MKPHTILENCGNDDVVELGSGVVKMDKLKEAMITCFKDIPNRHTLSALLGSTIQSSLPNSPLRDVPGNGWFDEGVDCKILQVNKGWVKGRIKVSVSVEFYPDEGSVE